MDKHFRWFSRQILAIGAEGYIQLCIVRVAVNFWEVAFNDLKRFARVDSEKQGAQNMTLEETDRRDYHLLRHAGTSHIYIRFKPDKRIGSYSQIRLNTTNQLIMMYRVKSCA